MVNWGDIIAKPPKAALPKLTKMRNRAIFADVIATPKFVTTGHQKGVNVLYGHGGANWVLRPVFDDNLKQCGDVFAPAFNDFQLKVDAKGEAIGGVWYDFDRGERMGAAAPPPAK